MAAFGTVKPGFEKAAQLQFPQQFSREYAKRQLGLRYAPNDAAPVVQDYVGDDFFADYQAQKREDARRSVLAGVADTRRSTNRALVSHAGYYGLPEPVRHQRRIGSDVGNAVGANIYYGAGISNAQAIAGSALEGGVLGSREGRNWAKNALQKRTAELDAIDAAQAEGPSVQAAVEKGIEPGQLEETEAAVIWQRILQETRAGNFTADTIALLPRAAKALVDMFSVPENLDKLDDYQYEIDDAATALRASMVAAIRYAKPETIKPYMRGQRTITRTEDGRTRRIIVDSDGNELTGAEADDTVADRLDDARVREVVANNEILALDFLRSALKYLELIGEAVQKVGVPNEKQLKSISRSAAKESKLGVPIKIRELGMKKEASSEDRRGRLTRDLVSSYDSGSTSFTPDGTSYEDSSGPSSQLSREELRDVNQDIFGRQGQRGEFRGERNFFGEDTDRSNWRPGVEVIDEAPRAFSRIIQDQGTDIDSKEDEEQGDQLAEDDRLERVRDAAEEMGITNLSDLDERLDAMSASQASAYLNRIAVRLRSAYEGTPTTASRDVATAKRQINELLTAAYR